MTPIENVMMEYAELEEEPKLGIFWYDDKEKRLFGVTKQEACDINFSGSQNLKTVRSLHKTWWNRQRQLLLQGKINDKVYYRDYTLVPRGMIFQDRQGKFFVMCGSWMNDEILSLVKNEFFLDNVELEVVIDEHWELGHGWSE
ncbi:MAG: hypothetical protein LBG72_04925 [Spirochaetaceae bacterium]|jgi:hypothetical protein|nr:hypothetical protein [Spirochaetaceae bacterium]